MIKKYNTITLSILTILFCCFILCCGNTSSAFPDAQIYIAGIGPGDPDLMTIRAMKAIEKADIIAFYPFMEERIPDYMKGKEILRAPFGIWHYYGKKESQCKYGRNIEECRKIVSDRNKFIEVIKQNLEQKKIITVLTSGDPLIYGPWAWILEEFHSYRIMVIPGISSFNAANAALRKSPTIAPKTKSVILTASDFHGKGDTLEKLVKHKTSMAIFTMRQEFDYFISKLRTGYSPDTPVAIVMHAGYKDKESVITGTLGNISEKVKGKKLPFEYMIYVGKFLTYEQKK